MAYRTDVVFFDTSGNIVTGWTGAASFLVIDGAAVVSGAAPGEDVSATGMGHLDLSAGNMNGSLIQIKCTVTNANALPYYRPVFTGGVAQVQAGLATSSAMAAGFASILAAIGSGFNWAAAAVEQVGVPTTYIGYMMRLAQIVGNAFVRNGASQTSFKADGVTPAFSCVVVDGNTTANRSTWQ